MNWRLSQKVLMIVSFPLICGLIFVGTLWFLLSEAEKTGLREQRVREAVDRCYEVNRKVVFMAAAVSLYAQNPDTGGVEYFKKTEKELEEDIKHLQASCVGNVKATEAVERNSQVVRNLIGYANEMVRMIYLGDGLAPMRMLQLKQEMTESATGLRENYTDFRRAMLTEVRQGPNSLMRFRDQAKLLLVLGIFGSIGVSVAMAIFLSRQITSRLEVLSENNTRLKQQQELLPPVGGADEITALDAGFRSMATELLEAIRKEKLIMDRMPAGLLFVDKDGTILQVNQRAAELLEFEPEQLKAKSLDTLFTKSEDNSIDVLDMLKQQVSGRTLTGPIATASGNVRNVELSMDEITLGDARGYLFIFLDVSAKFELQRIKQQLVAMIAHDVATPLTAMVMTLPLFRSGRYGELNSQGERKIDQLEREANRILKLWQDLLKVEKFGITTFSIERQTVHLDQVLQHSTAAAQIRAQEKNIEIVIDTLEDIMIQVDEDRMIQVIVNLLTNAIKFSPPNSQIRISTTVRPDEVELRVSDEGRGIPEQMLDSIFEPFKQSQVSDAAEKGGAGLGLAICKSIVESHQGKMGVFNNPGKGATFWISLPTITGDDASA